MQDLKIYCIQWIEADYDQQDCLQIVANSFEMAEDIALKEFSAMYENTLICKEDLIPLHFCPPQDIQSGLIISSFNSSQF